MKKTEKPTETLNRYHFEQQLWNEGYQRIMGLDEVGRGCLCGPVVAAGVILHPEIKLDPAVADSKTLDKNSRLELSAEIRQKAVYYTIQQCSPAEIDQLNILKASIRAMLKCTGQNGADPDYLLVDGNRFTASVIPYTTLVKGDNRSVSIAAASILAKVYRDQIMEKLHEEFPVFGWNSNVGYPTKNHFAALMKYGATKHHRRSFALRTNKKYEPPAT